MGIALESPHEVRLINVRIAIGEESTATGARQGLILAVCIGEWLELEIKVRIPVVNPTVHVVRIPLYGTSLGQLYCHKN